MNRGLMNRGLKKFVCPCISEYTIEISVPILASSVVDDNLKIESIGQEVETLDYGSGNSFSHEWED